MISYKSNIATKPSGMNFKIISKILFLLICVILVQSCQPSVRFASKSYGSRAEKASNRSSDKSAPKIDKLEKQKEIEEIEFLTGDDFTDAIITNAENWLGVPYRYGGESKSGVDCSGLVKEVFGSVGVKVPRTSSEQFQFTQQIDFVDKQAGDLIFFKKNGTVNHVGIYLGQGYMIHASTSSGVIRQSIHDSYFMNRVAGIGRVKPNLSKKD